MWHCTVAGWFGDRPTCPGVSQGLGSKGRGEQGGKGPSHGFHRFFFRHRTCPMICSPAWILRSAQSVDLGCWQRVLHPKDPQDPFSAPAPCSSSCSYQHLPRRVQHRHPQHPGYRCPNHPPAPPSSFHHPLPPGNGCLAACFLQTKCHQQLSLGAPGTRLALEEPPAFGTILKTPPGCPLCLCGVTPGFPEPLQAACSQHPAFTAALPAHSLHRAAPQKTPGWEAGGHRLPSVPAARSSYNQHPEGGWTQLFNGHLPGQRAGCGAPSPAPCSPRPASGPAPKISPWRCRISQLRAWPTNGERGAVAWAGRGGGEAVEAARGRGSEVPASMLGARRAQGSQGSSAPSPRGLQPRPCPASLPHGGHGGHARGRAGAASPQWSLPRDPRPPPAGPPGH